MAVTATDTSGNQTTNTYEVDSSGTGATLTYDASGNLTGDGTLTFTWDAENGLLSVSIGTKASEFTYDGLDRRVRIVEKDAGVTTSDRHLVWCEFVLCEERDATGASVTKRFFDERVQHRGSSYFYSVDHLGSVRELADNGGTVRARYDYDAWGRRTKVAGETDADIGFTGHYEHAPSGLTLAQYRAYDANSGRWISEDPIGLFGGLDKYTYVDGNPLA